MIKVSIVDDNLNVREGLEALINGTDGYECVATYASCESMLNSVNNKPPHVLLMDLSLPGISGIEGIKRVKKLMPNVNILVLTIHEENEFIIEALCAGAAGYVVKGISPAKLLEFIKEVNEGGAPMSSTIARKIVTIIQHTNQKPKSDEIHLSAQEERVLQKLSTGNTYEAIAQELNISFNTIKFHVRNIYSKLQSNNRTEAIAKAIRLKIIDMN
ncbi:response regulator transcription factor [bacterium]|nr:response regulator transcription factor [bacterium]